MSGMDLGIGEQLQRARVRGLGEPVERARPVEIPEDGVDGPQQNSFSQALESALQNVNGLSKDVGQRVESLASGEPVALHDIMMAMGKSEVSFNLMLEVRNKLVEAWERLSRSVV